MSEGKQVKDQIPISFGPGDPVIDSKTTQLLAICGSPDLARRVMLKLREMGFTGPGEVTVTIYTDRSFDVSLGSRGMVEFNIGF